MQMSGGAAGRFVPRGFVAPWAAMRETVKSGGPHSTRFGSFVAVTPDARDSMRALRAGR